MRSESSDERLYRGKTARLLAIILRLSQSNHWSPGALAQHLGVAERTIYRDLNAIRAAGLPIRYDDDRGGYIIDWACPVPIPEPKMRTDRRPERFRWRDKNAVCGSCGREFVWTARQQQKRMANVRDGVVDATLPPYCSPSCATKKRSDDDYLAAPNPDLPAVGRLTQGEADAIAAVMKQARRNGVKLPRDARRGMGKLGSVVFRRVNRVEIKRQLRNAAVGKTLPYGAITRIARETDHDRATIRRIMESMGLSGIQSKPGRATARP